MTSAWPKSTSSNHTYLKELSSGFRVDVVPLKGGVALLPEVEPGLLVPPEGGVAYLPQIVLHLYVQGGDSYET